MNNENIEEILKNIGKEEIPADVHKIAQETSNNFSSSLRQTRQPKRHILLEQIMRSRITKLAAAAVIIIACVIGLSLWRTTGSGIVLADVLDQIVKVKAFRYKSSLQFWSTKVTGEDPNKKYNFREQRYTSLSSQEYGTKSTGINPDPNGGWSTFSEVYFLSQKKTFILIQPRQKRYTRRELDDAGFERLLKQSIFTNTDPRTFLKQILETKYESIGRSTIDGIEVEGFRTTDPNWPGNDPNSRVVANMKMWVDVKTRLPVQFERSLASVEVDQMGDRGTMHLVTHEYQWDVPVDAVEFEPPPVPDGYEVVDRPGVFEFDEEAAIEGLKQCIELFGSYITISESEGTARAARATLWALEKSETPAALQMKEEIKGLTETEKLNRVRSAGKPVIQFIWLYKGLDKGKKDPAYYGQTVTPKDADKVLLRWKVSDNEYRVIYGNLHAETVTPEKLAELEAALPK